MYVRIVAASLVLALVGLSRSAGAADVDFQRDVRPILSAACYSCHGPDAEHREADLRFDTQEGATADLGGYAAVVPGDPANSSLIERVTSTDPDTVMPPPDSGQELTQQQIDTLRRWIAEGAKWSRHWAFVPPEQPTVPDSRDWGENAVDAFVLARMTDEGLAPESRADRVTLLRRLSLDLIGLPPTPEEADAFVADNSDDAYRRQVERLLKSPHFGERWGRIWLDAARYADSDGFEKDKPRRVWMYRDWVVDALNRDQPYDEFIVDQIAGDLQPGATQDQRVATGFLRNSMINEEGGIDPEQFRMEAMFDRMDAVGKAILGLTIQCGQCHSHKYDPLTQTEYYRMFAFLNNSHEANISVYSDEERKRREDVLRKVKRLEEDLKARIPKWRDTVADWARAAENQSGEWTVLPIENAGNNAQRYFPQPDGSLLAQGYAPTKLDAQFKVTTDLPTIRAFRLEALTDPNLPAGGPGRSVDGLFALTEFKVEAVSAVDPTKRKSVKFSGAVADFSNSSAKLGTRFADKQGKRGRTGPAAYAIDGDDATAWGIDAGPGRRNQPREAIFWSEENLAYEGGTVLTVHLVQKHGGWNSDDNQNMNLGRFRVSASGDEPISETLLPPNLAKLVAEWSDQPTSAWPDDVLEALFSQYRTTVRDWQKANDEIESMWARHPAGTTQLVLAERREPRMTHRLERGDFLKQLEGVSPGVPEFLHSLESPAPSRLDFARWLVDRRSPTTARAIVNRVWQAYFGLGLVSTPEDLGLQGELPTHAALLDWLAVDLMDHDWSLKRLHRQIVTSSTYQQASTVSPEKRRRDPYNELLSRGPRFRSDAEVVRDVALAASGLLDRTMGGPPVYPPAPDFLFLPPASYGPKTWNTATGTDRYRRAIYTFRFRSVPYPALEAFDTPNADVACVRRSRSNTPLQALTTLNEPLFIECAQALARSAVQDGGDSIEDRLTYAFRRALTRRPSHEERDVLLQFHQQTLEDFAMTPQAAQELAGQLPDNERVDVSLEVSDAELAAWTALCRVLLNLDETITKE